MSARLAAKELVITPDAKTGVDLISNHPELRQAVPILDQLIRQAESNQPQQNNTSDHRPKR
jgi:hypothetical protein